MCKRTSKKQVEEVLELATFREKGYQLIKHDYCGRYEYSINRYSREAALTDMWGKVYSWGSWKFEETLLHTKSLKEAHAFSLELLDKVLKEWE